MPGAILLCSAAVVLWIAVWKAIELGLAYGLIRTPVPLDDAAYYRRQAFRVRLAGLVGITVLVSVLAGVVLVQAATRR
jgi:hypothetical protein